MSFSKIQVDILEDAFASNPYPSGEEMEQLGPPIELTKPQVQRWFQRRRRRMRKSLEVDSTQVPSISSPQTNQQPLQTSVPSEASSPATLSELFDASPILTCDPIAHRLSSSNAESTSSFDSHPRTNMPPIRSSHGSAAPPRFVSLTHLSPLTNPSASSFNDPAAQRIMYLTHQPPLTNPATRTTSSSLIPMQAYTNAPPGTINPQAEPESQSTIRASHPPRRRPLQDPRSRSRDPDLEILLRRAARVRAMEEEERRAARTMAPRQPPTPTRTPTRAPLAGRMRYHPAFDPILSEDDNSDCTAPSTAHKDYNENMTSFNDAARRIVDEKAHEDHAMERVVAEENNIPSVVCTI